MKLKRKASLMCMLILTLVISMIPMSAFAVSDEGPVQCNLWIGGVQVTSENADDVLGDGTIKCILPEGYGTKTWDGIKVILNNANIDFTKPTMNTYDGMTHMVGIFSLESIDIELIGENTISTNQTGKYISDINHIVGVGVSRGHLSIGGSGKLNIKYRKDDVENNTDVLGIEASNGIDIKDCELDINIYGRQFTYGGIYGISSANRIVVDGAEIKVATEAGFAYYTYAMSSPFYDVNFKGGILHAYGYIDQNTGYEPDAFEFNYLFLENITSVSYTSDFPDVKNLDRYFSQSPEYGGRFNTYRCRGIYFKSNHTITFNNNGHGDEIAPQRLDYGQKITKPTDPTEEGYVFGGWYTDEDLKTPYDFDDTVKRNLTLYAKWTKEYSVSFNTGEIEVEIPNMKVLEGSTVNLPNPNVDNYTLKGWFTDKDFKKPFTDADKVTEDMTLFAKWDKTYFIAGDEKLTFKKGTDKGIQFTIKRIKDDENCFEHFDSLKIDGETLVKDKDYTAKSGSTIIDVKPEYLEKLAVGDHEVEALFDDGSVEADFAINSEDKTQSEASDIDDNSKGSGNEPKTGDNYRIFEYMLMALLLGIAAKISYKRIKKDN